MHGKKYSALVKLDVVGLIFATQEVIGQDVDMLYLKTKRRNIHWSDCSLGVET